jgi:glycosyltransferase involved in cell wall biosynthesis
MDATTAPKPGEFDVTVQVQLPNEFDPKLGKTNIGITAAVETDRCNPKWHEKCASMTKVVVPSQHAKKNLESSGPLDNLLVIPEAYASECTLPESDLPIDTLPEFSTKFNFLVFGQLTGNNPETDRKNTFYTLKWLFEEFKDDPDVGIVIKTNASRNTLIDRDNVQKTLKGVINEARQGDFPRLHLLHGDMSNAEVAALYKHPSISCLVSATRGEGYGLPLLEAATSGLPIIATGWSGHTDFLNKGKYISLFYQLKEVNSARHDGNIFLPGMRWAEPSAQDFKKKVRKFHKSPDIPKQWAADLSKKVSEEYSLGRISNTYNELFDQLLKANSS